MFTWEIWGTGYISERLLYLEADLLEAHWEGALEGKAVSLDWWDNCFFFSPLLGIFLVRPILLSFWNNHQITILWQNYYQRVFFPLISRVNTCTHCRVLFIENVVIDFNLYRYYLNWKCWNIPFYRFWLTLSLNKNLWIENTTKYWKYAVLERKITIFKFYIYLKLMTENFFSAILGL
jgi:hypothetical protein